MLKQIAILILISFNFAACINHSSQAATRKHKHIIHRQIHTKKISREAAKHYQEVGYASWYGQHFHHRRTSSGERFNMFHLTAAHKTLPLHTYVRVTNLKNGKQVIVKINDRGPFIRNRTIDLSYAAAKQIGMVNRGVGPVSIKVIRV